MDLFKVLEYTTIFLVFTTTAVSIYLFNKLQKAFKYLSAFLVFTMLMQIMATYLNLHGYHNLFLFHLYTPIEFIIFSTIFYSISERQPEKNLILYLCISFVVFCIINAFFIESLDSFNSIARGIEGMLAICICIYFFYQLFISETTIDLLKYSFFWLFSGWLIYFSGTFFLYIYFNKSGTTPTYAIIHSILYIFLNLVYTYVLWLGSRKSTS